MSIINDLKKLFFAGSSITKSAAGKTGDFVQEEGAELLSKGKDTLKGASETILDKGSDIGNVVKDKAGTILDTTTDKLTEIGSDLSENPLVKRAGDGLEDLGSKVMDVGSDIGTKLGGFTESVGSTVMDKGGDALEKGKDISENVGEKVLDVKDKVVERASEVGDKISKKYQETSEKAEAWAKEEAAKPKRDFAEKDLDTGDSLLKGKDDFFSKADKYADGEYDSFSEGKVKIEDVDAKIENVAKKELPPLAGFNDLDGDGDDLIDDVEITK